MNRLDPSGLEVRLYETPVKWGYTHISVVVYRPCLEEFVSYDGSGPDFSRNLTIVGLGVGGPHPNRWPGKYGEWNPGDPSKLLIEGGRLVATISRYRSPDEEMKRLDNVFKKLKQQPVPVYNAIGGPNSATYAHQLINLAGFKYDGPIPNALGWNYNGKFKYGGEYFDTYGNPTEKYKEYEKERDVTWGDIFRGIVWYWTVYAQG